MAQRVDVESQERQKLSGGAITSIIAAAVLLLFIFQNTNNINIRFLWIHFSWPLWLYTIVMAVVGALTWFGLGVMRRHRRRVARREVR
jgi:uncharacterized integral membrane protein